MNVDANKVIDHLVKRISQSEKTIALLIAENQELKEQLGKTKQ